MTDRAVYSVYHKNRLLPVLSVAITGPCRFIRCGDDFFGNGDSYESEVIHNPTWAQVLDIANDMIKATGDCHHVFLEGVERCGADYDDGIPLYEFVMGS